MTEQGAICYSFLITSLPAAGKLVVVLRRAVAENCNLINMKIVLAFVSLGLLANLCFAGEVKIPFSYVTDGGPNGSMKLVTDFIHIPVQLANGVMQVKVGNIANDMSRIPSQALAAALKAYPKTSKFRVSWEVSAVHLHYRTTVLYDRNLKSIKYFYAGSGGVADSYRKFYSWVSVSQVNDKVIRQLSTSNKGETRASGPLGPLDTKTAGFTTDLTRYGAKIISSKNKEQKR